MISVEKVLTQFYNIDAIFIIIACTVIALVFILALAIKLAPKKHNDVEELLYQYLRWNEAIQTKQAVLDFYSSLSETYKSVWGEEFKLNITKQEFGDMSLDSIKQLNRQALEDLIQQLPK